MFRLPFVQERPEGRTGSVDLTGEAGLVVDLLNGHQRWRERLVQEFSFEGGVEARVESSYQIRLREELLGPFVRPGDTKARLIIPLGTRAKAALLNPVFSGPADVPAQLLPRGVLASHQANYLLALLEASPSHATMAPGLPRDLLEAICRFNPHRYRETRRDLNPRFGPRRDMEAIARYLADGTGLTPQPDPAVIRDWLRQLDVAKRVLVAALREPPNDFSSSENVLLALPELDRTFSTQAEVESVLDPFCAAINSARSPDDLSFLAALAEYGRRYEILIEVDVPFRQSFGVYMAEDRPLNLRWGRSTQLFAAGDAHSAHLEARALDHSVVFSRAPRATDLLGGPAVGFMDGLRATRETLSFYSSDEGRPYYVEIAFRLRISFAARATAIMLVALNLSAIGAALVSPRDGLYVERLGLLLVPTTIAAALVLARDQTALAARLQRIPKAVVAFSIVALWVVVVIELIAFHDPRLSSH